MPLLRLTPGAPVPAISKAECLSSLEYVLLMRPTRMCTRLQERGAPGSSAPSTKVVLVQEYATRGDMFDVKQKLGGRIKPAQVWSLWS